VIEPFKLNTLLQNAQVFFCFFHKKTPAGADRRFMLSDFLFWLL